MSRSGRLIDLVHLLGGRTPRTVEDIAQRFEVSPRTVFRDLAELEAFRIPVDRSERGYRLLDTATLPPLNLTPEEWAVLRLALSNPALRGRSGIRRLLERMEPKLEAAAGAATADAARPVALAGWNRSGPAAENVFETLRQAIADRRRCELLYEALSTRRKERRKVDPYLLFERAQSWYLAAYCHRRKGLRTFRLDRIDEATTLDERFEPDPGFDLGEYLSGAWDVFRGDGHYEVVLLFDSDLAPLIARAHHSRDERVTTRSDGRLEYRVSLSHLDEIARWVAGFGGEVRVVAPAALRRIVLRLAEGTQAANGPKRPRPERARRSPRRMA